MSSCKNIYVDWCTKKNFAIFLWSKKGSTLSRDFCLPLPCMYPCTSSLKTDTEFLCFPKTKKKPKKRKRCNVNIFYYKQLQKVLYFIFPQCIFATKIHWNGNYVRNASITQIPISYYIPSHIIEQTKILVLHMKPLLPWNQEEDTNHYCQSWNVT